MDKRLLDILCCPTTKLPLRLLDESELAALNRAIADTQVADAAGTRIGARVAAGLITRDGRTIYRVEDDIPIMLADTAIATAQLSDFPGP
ncbi:MAG TPA: Trm112 family protein [Dokdonella sp.]